MGTRDRYRRWIQEIDTGMDTGDGYRKWTQEMDTGNGYRRRIQVVDT